MSIDDPITLGFWLVKATPKLITVYLDGGNFSIPRKFLLDSNVPSYVEKHSCFGVAELTMTRGIALNYLLIRDEGGELAAFDKRTRDLIAANQAALEATLDRMGRPGAIRGTRS